MNDIKKFIYELNQAWRDQRYNDLCNYFHDDVVMLPPDQSEPVVGVGPMVESYKQFGLISTLHQFNITELKLYEYGSVTMCHMQFEIEYEIESSRFQENGLEVYAIDTTELAPKVVWRTQLYS